MNFGCQMSELLKHVQEERKDYLQVALALLRGTGGHRASAGARRLLILIDLLHLRLGWLNPQVSLWQLLFLEGSWKRLPSVLTTFWAFHLVCGSWRWLQGVEGSWASPHWVSLPHSELL